MQNTVLHRQWGKNLYLHILSLLWICFCLNTSIEILSDTTLTLCLLIYSLSFQVKQSQPFWDMRHLQWARLHQPVKNQHEQANLCSCSGNLRISPLTSMPPGFTLQESVQRQHCQIKYYLWITKNCFKNECWYMFHTSTFRSCIYFCRHCIHCIRKRSRIIPM